MLSLPKKSDTFLLALLAPLLLVALLTHRTNLQQAQLASHLIRLHVVANSDSDFDQALKLQVRDAVLTQCATLLKDEKEIAHAYTLLQSNLDTLARAGYSVTQHENAPCTVRTRLVYESFPHTDYTTFSLPAGQYRALRVELGKAKGHNWWCVVYPALCLTPVTEQSEPTMAQELTEQDVKLMSRPQQGFEIRFRCLEWFQQWCSSLQSTADSNTEIAQ